MEQLLAVLDNKISQERAEQLLQEAEGSVEAALAIFFSTDHPEAGSTGPSSSSQLQQLVAIVGPGVSQARLRRLLSRAGSAARAADLYFTEAGPEAEVAAPAGPSQPEGSLQPSSVVRPRRQRRRSAVPRSPSLTLDSDEDQSDAAPAEPPAHATSGPRTMQITASAELFQGFLSTLGSTLGSGQPQLHSASLDDSDDVLFPGYGSDGSDGPGFPVMDTEPMNEDHDSDDDAGDQEMSEQQDAETEAGPSTSGAARDILAVGCRPRCSCSTTFLLVSIARWTLHPVVLLCS